MDIDEVEKIIDGYVDWWRRGVSVYQAGDGARIVLPMLDRHNDHMSIYIADDPDTGGYVITDLGAILDDLAFCGCDVLASAPRTQKLDMVTSGFGLERSGTELYRKTGTADLFQSLNFLMQGMATVDDLFFTTRESARTFFLDDISNWFGDNGVPVVPNVRIPGKSGFDGHFDFVIPKIGDRSERLVKAIANPSQESVKNALFGFGDIKDARPASQWVVVLNEVGREQDEKTGAIVEACVNYGVKPVKWVGVSGKYEELMAA